MLENYRMAMQLMASSSAQLHRVSMFLYSIYVIPQQSHIISIGQNLMYPI
jgi:hypothetical protein